ncbi:MAG: Stk1 family PASTA domain-containing Ser/Thr kinase [Lachnospiraceae bacterium]|nr:Stk1 family PASTA domain-containing Ser/Thr kinase [Lachnospiraceae bacterium]
MLRPGVYLQNRYEVLEQVGSGGMSEVYKAKCHKLNRLVAVKVLKEEFSSDAGFVSKFKMEAQAAARLSHPNIVNVYDVIDEGKLHYIVMELIEGVTLKGYIARKGKLEAKESIGIGIQVAQGIAAAHEQGIIHRDIKPQNVIISMDGKVKVTDFGIARGVSTQTLTSAAMGSVHYISPEQARGGYSDNRSDIYSLGITLYEMLTGRVPYEGDNTVAIALAHLEEAMVPPSVYNPEIPASLERIILKCTAKKPENRYGSANELIADLRKALVQPEGDFVQDPEGQMALNGHTVKISGKDLARIKEQYTPVREEPVREYVRKPTGETAATRYPQNNRRPAKEPDRRQVREQPDEINSHIEKILAAAGVVVAIIIVAVLIVVFSKLGGIFQSGSGLFGRESTAPSADAIVQTGEDGAILKDTEVYMPDVLELPEDLAEAKLKENFLGMKPTYQASDVVEKGYVISQDPEYGTVVAKYSNVNVVVSLGSDKVDLTTLDLETMSVSSVRRLLEDKGLTVQVTEEESETVEKGMLIRYEPQKASEGGTVTLYVSTGPHVDQVPVPDLVGKTEPDALALLGESGLLPGNTSTETSDTVPKGCIIRQEGGENGQIQVGGQISYVVSSGPEERQQRYVASISDVYDLSNLIGPGAIGANVTVLVRLHQQDADGTSIYRTLSEARTINGSSLLPINYTSIESMNGSDKGEVEVVDVESGAVLKSYPLTFFPMD